MAKQGKTDIRGEALAAAYQLEVNRAGAVKTGNELLRDAAVKEMVRLMHHFYYTDKERGVQGYRMLIKNVLTETWYDRRSRNWITQCKIEGDWTQDRSHYDGTVEDAAVSFCWGILEAAGLLKS